MARRLIASRVSNPVIQPDQSPPSGSPADWRSGRDCMGPPRPEDAATVRPTRSTRSDARRRGHARTRRGNTRRTAGCRGMPDRLAIERCRPGPAVCRSARAGTAGRAGGEARRRFRTGSASGRSQPDTRRGSRRRNSDGTHTSDSTNKWFTGSQTGPRQFEFPPYAPVVLSPGVILDGETAAVLLEDERVRPYARATGCVTP